MAQVPSSSTCFSSPAQVPATAERADGNSSSDESITNLATEAQQHRKADRRKRTAAHAIHPPMAGKKRESRYGQDHLEENDFGSGKWFKLYRLLLYKDYAFYELKILF